MGYAVYPVYCCQNKDKDHSGAIAATTALGAGAGGFYSHQLLKKDPLTQIKIASKLNPDNWVKSFFESIDMAKADEALKDGKITQGEYDAIKKVSERLGQFITNPLANPQIEEQITEGMPKDLKEVVMKVVGFFKNAFNFVQVGAAENTLKSVYAELTPEMKKKLVEHKIIDGEKEAKIAEQISKEKAAVLLEKAKFHGPRAAIGAAVGLAVALILNDFSKKN